MIEFGYKISPGWLAAGLAGVILLLWAGYHQAKGRPSRGLKALLLGLRLLTIVAVVLCLLNPERVEALKHEQNSRIAVLLDASRSMSIQDVGGSRLDAAKEWAAARLAPLAPPGVQISHYTFDGRLNGLAKLDSASPTGAVTALAESLETLLALPDPNPLTGVVLLSDGIDNTSESPARVARMYRRKGIPIHTVTVGTTNEMQDVVLENVQVKRAVPNEAPTRLVLQLRSPGFAGRTASLQVRSQENFVAARQVRLSGGAQRIELELTPRQKGFQIYEASITTQPGEWLTSNNRRLFGLEVTDPTIHVLYMEGTPQQSSSPLPEWKYLKDALRSDPNIQVKVLFRQFGSDGQFLNTIDSDPETGDKIYPVEHPREGFPRTLAGLLEYDVVIHSDIKKESFTPDQLRNMARLVEEYGGGFVMIGGNSAFGKGGYHRTVLDRIIPVAMEQENDSQAHPFHLKLARGALAHPVMDLGSTPEETAQIWTSKFPYLHGFNRVDRAKPGAVVLAENPAYRTPYGAGVLLAVQEIGKGRSMAFTSDTTRSWGKDFETIWGEPVRPGALNERNSDSRYYRQFWVNAVRWLANGKVARTNNPVTLELARSYAAPGESIAAEIKVRDSSLNEVAHAEVLLSFSSGGKTNRPVRARYDAARRAFLAELRPERDGEFIVTATARRSGVNFGEDRQLLVTEGVDLEMRDLRARPNFMALLARDSKGENFALPAGDSTTLRLFANAPPPRVEYRREPLWDQGTWLLLLLGLLGSEWTIRRMRGLA